MRPYAIALAAALLLNATVVHALPIEIDYTDPPGTGFDDPVLGSARRNALEFAVDVWRATLGGAVPVVVEASMPGLRGSGASALLASAGPTTLQRNFPGAPAANTFYPPALANQMSGTDANGPELSEITIRFNAAVDNAAVLGSVDWYYGLDARPGTDIDLVSIALHELGHGLGFSQVIDPATGGFVQNTPSAFDLHVVRPGVGVLDSMRGSERRAAIISDQLFWGGPHVFAAAGGPAPLFAPNPFQSGSSVAHWDASLAELMAPFFVAAIHEPGLLLPALVDMGWELAAGRTPLPSAPPTATPTTTASPTATPSPTVAARSPRTAVYVSNYDDSRLSVIDAESFAVTAGIPVGDGPLGVAATADGRLVVTADFQAHALSLVATSLDAVVGVIPLPGAPNDIVITADGARAFVSLTDIDSVAAVDLHTREVVAVIPVGRSPSGLALTADGRGVVVAHFNERNTGLVDTETLLYRARVRSGDLGSGFTTVVMPAGGGDGFVTAFRSRRLWSVDPSGFSVFSPRPAHPNLDLTPEAGVFSPDGSLAYFVAYRTDGLGWVMKIDTETGETRMLELIAVGDVPQAIAITADGSRLFVANTGSNTVSVVDPARTRVAGTVDVGAAPMGIAVVVVPRICVGDCDGDAVTTVDELIAGLDIGLGGSDAAECSAFDTDLSRSVTVDEIVAAVQASLLGCE